MRINVPTTQSRENRRNHPPQGCKTPSENIYRIPVLFFEAPQRPATDQLDHAIHHKLTTKAPQKHHKKTPLFPTPPQKRRKIVAFTTSTTRSFFLEN